MPIDDTQTQGPTQTQDTTQSSPQLDPDVVNLAKAIRQTESGGNFTASGKSGEYGAYQFTNDTWNKEAPQYGINVPLSQATPGQQNAVAYNKIKAWKDAGNNVTQIASMWNAGEGEPNAYTGTFADGSPAIGTNKFGAKYDVPTYAKSVANAYLTLKNGGQVSADPNNPSSTANTTPVIPPVQLSGSQKPSPDILTEASNLVSKLFPGKEVGESIGTLAGYIQAKVNDAKNGTDTASHYDLSAPTPLQTAADIGQGALLVGGGEAAKATTSVGGRLLEAGGIGATTAGLGTVAGGDNNLKDIGTNAAIGGAVGLGTAGILEAGSGIINKVGNYISPMTQDDIIKMAQDPNITDKDAAKQLNKADLARYYQSKTQAAQEDLSNDIDKKVEQAKQDQVDLKQKIVEAGQERGSTANQKAEELKPVAAKMYSDNSNIYVQKTQQAMDDAVSKGFQKDVDAEDIKSQIASHLETDESGLGESIQKDLGIKPEVEQTDEETGLPVIKADAEPTQKVSTDTILSTAKGYIQKMNKASLSGAKVYSPDDYELMQKYSTLMKVLGDNGVDMTDANKFYREWAPLRKTITTKIRPFNRPGDVASSFGKTLLSATSETKTGVQQDTKLESQKLVSNIEEALEKSRGLEPGSLKGTLTKEVQDTTDKLSAAQKAKIDAKDIADKTIKTLRQQGNDKIFNVNKPGSIAYGKENAKALQASKDKISKAVLTVLKGLGIVGLGYEGAKRIL